MFNQNVTMLPWPHPHATNHEYVIHVTDVELDALFEKHGGQVNVKITKPSSPGTEEQNRLAHLLLSEYYKSGFHNAPEGSTLDFFKVWMKMKYGPCYSMDMDGNMIKVPKSWSLFSKNERSEFISGLISEIIQSGAATNSFKISEILKGLEENA